jgi:putative transposase
MSYVRWTPRLRRYVVRQALMGITPISEIARNRNVPRRTIYYLLKRFKEGGFEALEPKPKGRKKETLNPKFVQLVIEEWKKHKCGSHKMWLRLKSKGFSVSQRKIQEIYNEQGFKLNRRKRPNQIKFVKYERENPNELWHTDWTTDPVTGQQLIAFIDDCTRVLIHAEIFAHATTENTILAFKNAIARYGKPKAILTDNGTQFTPARAEKGPFTRWCEKQGIKHILGRVHHPQTNGKIERWFGTYKLEYDERFDNLQQFIKYYNENRLHQGIGYLTPKEKWDKLNCVQN